MGRQRPKRGERQGRYNIGEGVGTKYKEIYQKQRGGATVVLLDHYRIMKDSGIVVGDVQR